MGDSASALWLVDCVQALGKLPLDLASTRIDYAPFSGHKLYAPKGIGLLYVRAGAPFTPLIVGGGQEAGLRSGTENMAGIAALGAVLAALERGASSAPWPSCRLARPAGGQRCARPFRPWCSTRRSRRPADHAEFLGARRFQQGAAGRLRRRRRARQRRQRLLARRKAAPSYVLHAMGLPAWRRPPARAHVLRPAGR
ncbi:MAG: aminotransferase class V-fold PLP-dependent enzyme [Mesorhizobium sp.]